MLKEISLLTDSLMLPEEMVEAVLIKEIVEMGVPVLAEE